MSKFWLVLGLIFSFIVIITGGLIWVFKGTRSFLWALLAFIVVMGIITILFLIILAVWWIFQPQRVDAVRLNRDRIISSAKLNSPSFEQVLYFKGSEEWEYKEIGRIVGVCRLKVKKKGDNFDYEDCIVFKERAGLLSLFLSPKIVRVMRHERTSLNADKVYLKAMSFTPELFGFLFLPNRFRDADEESEKVSKEIRRYSAQEVLKEEINIIQDAIAISPRHQKQLERENLTSVPHNVVSGGNNNG